MLASNLWNCPVKKSLHVHSDIRVAVLVDRYGGTRVLHCAAPAQEPMGETHPGHSFTEGTACSRRPNAITAGTVQARGCPLKRWARAAPLLSQGLSTSIGEQKGHRT